MRLRAATVAACLALFWVRPAAAEVAPTEPDDEEEVEDEVEGTPPPPAPDSGADLHALAPELRWTDEEIKKRIAADPASLGPLSVGRTNGGALLNGVQMPKSDRWDIIDPGHAWGTRETIDYLTAAIAKVHQQFPGSHKLYIGHISAKRGGHLRPHKSHQSGRDVDISYFYKVEAHGRWYMRATADTLDVPRTWAFVRAMLTETDVEFIFINTSVQKLLKQHALQIGEDAAWLDRVFQLGSRDPWPIIRHAHGHDTHIHVRFYNPVAQELGRRAYPELSKRGLVTVKSRDGFVSYRARKGDLLVNLAKRFGTTVAEIQSANGLRNSAIKAGRVYLIPRKGGKTRAKKLDVPPKVVVPPRRLPPDATLQASVERQIPAGG
jgi:penicillin-insensitive murein endopeptidase